MGLVRKTLSISTLGLVNFRSKKELLKRAEADLSNATGELEREHAARAVAEARIAAAEKKATAAELRTLKAAKDAAKLRGRKGKQARTILERLNDAVDAAEPKVRHGAEEAGRRGRRAAKKARKATKEATARAQVEAKKARKATEEAAARAKVEAKRARKRAEPYVERATDAARELADDVKARASR